MQKIYPTSFVIDEQTRDNLNFIEDHYSRKVAIKIGKSNLLRAIIANEAERLRKEEFK